MLKTLTVVLMATLSGCAVFDGGNVPKTTLSAYEGDASAKPSVSYTSMAMGGLSGPKELPEASQSIIEGELLAVLESSQYFSRISKKDDASDISISVTLTNRGNPAAVIPAIITGLSLYTIPSWATDHFDVVANVERRDGLSKSYVLADSSTIVQWLPMIFVFPAKNFSVVPEVRKNMYKKVLSDMQKDGFFTYDQNTVALVK